MTTHMTGTRNEWLRYADRAARGREGAHAAQRRAGAAAAGAAVGSDRQGVSIRDRRGERLAGGPLPRALAASRLPLHVRARLQGGLSGLLGDRGRLQRLRRPPGQPRRHALGGVPGAAREAAGVQTADGLDVSLGVLVRQRLQLRLRCLGSPRSSSARAASNTTTGARRCRRTAETTARARHPTGPDYRVRGHERNRRGHLHAREAGHERVRARGRRRLPHLFRLCARTGRPLGHVPVARPRTQGAQRDGLLVAPPRRIRQALIEVVAWLPSRARHRGRRRRSACSDRASSRARLTTHAIHGSESSQ